MHASRGSDCQEALDLDHRLLQQWTSCQLLQGRRLEQSVYTTRRINACATGSAWLHDPEAEGTECTHASTAEECRALSALCEALLMRHNHFSLNGFFGLIGKEPASVARDLTAFSWPSTCNPAEQTHPRTQARRPSASSESQSLSSMNGCSSSTSAASKLAPANPN